MAGDVDGLGDCFAQAVLWGYGGSSFTVDDRLFIATALTRLSKTVRTSDSEFVNHAKGLLDEVEASEAALKNADKEAEPCEGLISVAEKIEDSNLNDVTSLHR